MKILILSRRHAESASWCDACGRVVGKGRAVAKLVVRDGNSIVAEVRACAPCLRDAARAADPVRP